MPRRIAILHTNTDTSVLSRRYPNVGQKVAAALQPLRPDWAFEVWQAKDGEFPPDPSVYQGWVLSGSVASVNDDAPWMLQLAALVRTLHARQAPLMGLCFGHQMIAKALGGRVGPSPGGMRLGVATTHFEAQSWMRPWQEQLTLFAAHEEQVLEPPAGARVLGGDAWAAVGALGLGRHVFTTQYHPELSREFMGALLAEHGGAFAPAVVERAQVQLQQPVDAALFMRWAAQFLEQAAEV